MSTPSNVKHLRHGFSVPERKSTSILEFSETYVMSLLATEVISRRGQTAYRIWSEACVWMRTHFENSCWSRTIDCVEFSGATKNDPRGKGQNLWVPRSDSSLSLEFYVTILRISLTFAKEQRNTWCVGIDCTADRHVYPKKTIYTCCKKTKHASFAWRLFGSIV